MSMHVRYVLPLLSALFISASLYGQEEEEYILLPYVCEDPVAHLYADEFANSLVTFTSSTGTASEGTTAIIYYDGMGRLKEEVNVGATPSHNDMVTFYEYDAMNRKTRQWQPSTVSPSLSGDYVWYSQYTSAASEAWQDTKPYTEYVYEKMPGGRMVKTTGPGNMWHSMDKSVRHEYLTNVSGNDTLDCVLYVAGTGIGGTPSLTASGSYPTGTLMVTRMSDEDGVTVMEFTDRQERMVLSRRIEHNGGGRILHDTYYIYDSRGNHVMTLPPLLSDGQHSGTVPANLIEAYAYVYGYDIRNRRCSSKVPGAGTVLTEYDGADRLLFVQTAVQRSRGESTFHIYDAFGRECLTGTCSYNIPVSVASTCRTEIPCCIYTGDTEGLMGYTLQGISLTDARVLTATYYDKYDFTEGHEELSYTPADGYGVRFNKAQGLLTGRATALLSHTKTDFSWLYEAVYYDECQRIVQKKSTNHTKGTDSHFYAYDFLGHETAHRHVHTSRIQPKLTTTTIETVTTYDHAGRLLTVTHSVNGNTPVTIKNIGYDELCRIKTDRRNGNQALVQEYTYNARSLLTGITGNLFNMSVCYGLGYDGNNSSFNGNIASIEWNVPDGFTRRYSFFYDGLSHLSEARYTDVGMENAGRYSTSYSYDKHGNIQSLRRNGMQDGGGYGIVDDLYYEYDGNRLCKVSNAVESPCYNGAMNFSDGADEETEYDYDADGNLIEDKNKGITRITYNVLNLPEHLDFKSGKYVNFTYSSTGEKLRSNYLLKLPEIYDPGTRSVSSDIFASGKFPPEWSEPVGPGLRDSLISRPDSMFTEEHYAMMYGAHIIEYCGDILYEDVNPVPNLILIDGGYVTFTNNKQPVYHFYLTDHQGNVRVVADENGTVEETNHYYPFGALFGESVDKNKQRYKYNGKELDRLLSLDWYDYGARWYDPVLARWHSTDPLADKYPDVSPYVYCLDNPVNAIDPDGKRVWVFATKLPDDPSAKNYHNYTPTHTFIVVHHSNGKIQRFEYGPQGDSFIDSFSGLSILQQCYYDKSGEIMTNYMNGIKDDNLKNVIEVNVPDGMTMDEFDQSIVRSAADFSNNKEIKYRMIPLDTTEGNCNTSTTSLLKNAGVSELEIKRIGTEIKGIKTGFGIYKAWTDKERRHVKNEALKMSESLSNHIGY